jgi:hypothetical protein
VRLGCALILLGVGVHWRSTTSCRSGTAPEPSGSLGFVAPRSWQVPLLLATRAAPEMAITGFALLHYSAGQPQGPTAGDGGGCAPGEQASTGARSGATLSGREAPVPYVESSDKLEHLTHIPNLI